MLRLVTILFLSAAVPSAAFAQDEPDPGFDFSDQAPEDDGDAEGDGEDGASEEEAEPAPPPEPPPAPDPEPQPSTTEPEAPLDEPEPQPSNTPTVRFRANTDGVVLHRQVDEDFEELCAAPCETQLEEGDYTFALSLAGDPVPNDSELQVDGDIDLLGTYEPRDGLHTAGWVVMVSSLAVGLAMIITGLAVDPDPDDGASDVGPTVGWLGTVIALGGGAAGIGMITAADHASVEVVR